MIRLASEVIAQYWPMRTFVHHNPLHSLEYLPFTETVRRGQQFVGGSGYLPGDLYRRYLKSGRIQVHHIEEALAPLARDQDVILGPCSISHRDVLRACMTHGLSASTHEPLDPLMRREPNEEQIEALAERLSSLSAPTVKERMTTTVRKDVAALGRQLTLSGSCDQTLGTHIVEQINAELIKWCEAFLDEGHATWSMPGREQGLYAAWKTLAVKEWTTCGIAESRRKIAALSSIPKIRSSTAWKRWRFPPNSVAITFPSSSPPFRVGQDSSNGGQNRTRIRGNRRTPSDWSSFLLSVCGTCVNWSKNLSRRIGH